MTVKILKSTMVRVTCILLLEKLLPKTRQVFRKKITAFNFLPEIILLLSRKQRATIRKRSVLRPLLKMMPLAKLLSRHWSIRPAISTRSWEKHIIMWLKNWKKKTASIMCCSLMAKSIFKLILPILMEISTLSLQQRCISPLKIKQQVMRMAVRITRICPVQNSHWVLFSMRSKKIKKLLYS